MQNPNFKIIIGENLRFSGSCGISSFFRLVSYFLNMICLIFNFYTKLHIYEFSYKFDIVLYQFLETGTSDRSLICIIQRLRFSGYILYPLSFFLYIPFKLEKLLKKRIVNLITLIFKWNI